MFPPEKDELDRRPVWDALQTFWMDSDANLDLTRVAELCANSKYSLADIEEIIGTRCAQQSGSTWFPLPANGLASISTG
jgi:hypothetical protein